jgi:hypothetical protein
MNDPEWIKSDSDPTFYVISDQASDRVLADSRYFMLLEMECTISDPEPIFHVILIQLRI